MGAKGRVAARATITQRQWDRLNQRVDELMQWAWTQYQLDLATGVMASTTKPPPPPPPLRRGRRRIVKIPVPAGPRKG